VKIVNQSKAIVVHERDDERSQLVELLREHSRIGEIVIWGTGDEFDLIQCDGALIAIVHASNEDRELNYCEALVKAFVASPNKSDATAYQAYRNLGSALRGSGVPAVVVVSNEYRVSSQVTRPEWSEVWPASVEQFLAFGATFIDMVGSGELPPLDFFLYGDARVEVALALLSALMPFGLGRRSMAGGVDAETAIVAEEDAWAAFETLVHKYVDRAVRGDIDHEMRRVLEGDPRLVQLAKACKESPEHLIGEIDSLCQSQDRADWTRPTGQLATLRDKWLGAAEGKRMD
jgi:hypothetical protein